jgi:hypothetical protein
MRRSALLGSWSTPARLAVASVALAACVWLPSASASGSEAAIRATNGSGGSFDHCLLGSWRLRAAPDGDFVGMTMHVALGHGVSFGHPFGVMTVDMAGSAPSKAYGTRFRGAQSVSITAGITSGQQGGYGVLRVLSNKVVRMEGPNAVPQPGQTILGTQAIYTCTSRELHITFFDNADLAAPATFARI